jgi:hypothetical protein
LTVAEGTLGRIFQRHYQSLREMGKLPVVRPVLTWAASHEKQRPRVLCEIHNECIRQLVLHEFSSFDYLCENCNESHILALPK